MSEHFDADRVLSGYTYIVTYDVSSNEGSAFETDPHTAVKSAAIELGFTKSVRVKGGGSILLPNTTIAINCNSDNECYDRFIQSIKNASFRTKNDIKLLSFVIAELHNFFPLSGARSALPI